MKRNVSVVCFKFLCNILISGKIIKEMMPGSVASGTLCILLIKNRCNFKCKITQIIRLKVISNEILNVWRIIQ
jgi:uncharacterized membrane protein